jgi:hypothetical protein
MGASFRSRHPVIRRVAPVLIAVLAIVTAIGTPRPASANAAGQRVANSIAQLNAPGCNSQFNIVSAPGGAVSSMAALSPTDVWAVGTFDPPQPPDGAHGSVGTVEHWDGASWSTVSVPIPSQPFLGGDEIRGVTTVPGSSTNNVWIVGRYAVSGGYVLVADQWNGTGWNTFTPPNRGAFSRLSAVAAISPTNLWAVGSDGHTLIEHFDGTAWTIIPSPDPTGVSSDSLSTVAATSATDIWAAGFSLTGAVGHTLIEHWDGTAWSIVPSPNVGSIFSGLGGLTALSASSAWAVGSWTHSAGQNETLVERWDGTSWSVVSSPNVAGVSQSNYLSGVAAPSPNNIWAVGGSVNATLVEHWDGTTWSIVPSRDQGSPSDLSALAAVVAPSPTDIWVGGTDQTPAYPGLYPSDSNSLIENLCIPTPTISSVAPLTGNTLGGTAVRITGTDLTYTTDVSFDGMPARSFSVGSNSEVTAVAPAEQAGAVDVVVTTLAGASAACICSRFVYVPPAVSWQQYRMVGSDGATWKPVDASALSLSLTPAADSNAILSGNADLWTATVGVNQDLGMLVNGGSYGSGQVVAWKESGGFGGTFSPNAAFVQTVIPLKGGTAYTATLVWKANHATTGTLFIAAGARPPAFSPTRLTAELVPATDANLRIASSTNQYALAASDGSAWVDMDPGILTIPFTPAASGSALLSVNADLWTQNAGLNQDLGISVSGGAFGAGQIVGWKESGGFAGTFSPNAAYVQTVVQLIAGTPYVIKVRWKANHATGGTIQAGAGLGPQFSPTGLVVRLLPGGTGLQDAASNQQYSKAGSTGGDWTALDSTNLQLSIAPASNALYILSANVDLWTASAGVNQDVGIVVSGGAYGTGILMAWKESGGFAGTFSPNAAFLQTVIPVAAATTYTVTLVWKANRNTTGTIYAGAGIGPLFSPTRITAEVTT